MNNFQQNGYKFMVLFYQNLNQTMSIFSTKKIDCPPDMLFHMFITKFDSLHNRCQIFSFDSGLPSCVIWLCGFFFLLLFCFLWVVSYSLRWSVEVTTTSSWSSTSSTSSSSFSFSAGFSLHSSLRDTILVIGFILI